MTNEERVICNENNGYKLVYVGDGYEVYKKENGVGGWTYFSDHYSNEGALPIFDSSTISKEEFIAIAKDAYGI